MGGYGFRVEGFKFGRLEGLGLEQFGCFSDSGLRILGIRGLVCLWFDTETQRAQYPLIKRYTLNHVMKPYFNLSHIP